MSEEADLIVEELKWLVRCNMNRYIIKGNVLSYEALYSKLGDEPYTYRFLWYNLVLPQTFGPPDVMYLSPAMAQDMKEDIIPPKFKREILPW